MLLRPRPKRDVGLRRRDSALEATPHWIQQHVPPKSDRSWKKPGFHLRRRWPANAVIKAKEGIVEEVADDRVILPEIAVPGNQTQNLIGEDGHRRKGLHFLVGQPRGLEDCALHDFVAVADERAPRVGAALDGVLHALGDGHFGDALDESLTPRGVGFGHGGGFRKGGFINRMPRTVKFVELILLLDGQRRAMLERRCEGGRFADAIEFFHERLDAESRQVADGENQKFGRAIFIFD